MPKPMVEYGYSNSNATIQTQWESGRVSQRSRFTGNRAMPKVSFTFTYAQLAVWEGFVENSLVHGSLEFQMPLPNPANQALELQTVLINGGNYEVNAIAGDALWKVTAQLIIQSKKSLSSAAIGMLSLFGGDGEDAVAFADLWHEVVHTTIPENFEPYPY